MVSNLEKIKNNLRSIAKRCKAIKYSAALAVSFAMLGINAFSEDTIITKKEINERTTKLSKTLKDIEEENEKKLKGLNLELVQLIEQGDQVVKSPWSSWQFGINYVYGNNRGNYKGRGDKKEKYYYNAVFSRPNWKKRNALDSSGDVQPKGLPITPGNDSLASWKNIDKSSNGEIIINKDTPINSSINGKKDWGLVEPRKVKEPINEIEILAKIYPKEVKKDAISLKIGEPKVEILTAPIIKPEVNKPLDAPVINTPEVENVNVHPLNINTPETPTAPTAPTINVAITAQSAPEIPNISIIPSNPSSPAAPAINLSVTAPTVNAMSIVAPSEVGNISVNPPTINPVDFMLTPKGLSSDNSRNVNSREYNLNGQSIEVNNQGNYISTWGRVPKLDGVDTNVTVTANDTRAFMIDEGIDYKDTTIKPFRYTGTITLNNSQNVGIDVQGTHTNYSDGTNTSPGMNKVENVANIQVINEGTIIGNGGSNVKNQVAFGFNNFDASSNNTRTEMINRGNGSVTLGAPESAGIQLRPEDPWSDNNGPKRGLNMMTGENSGTVTINSYGSFGILTVKNRNLSKFKANPNSKESASVRDYKDYYVKSTEGGQIASRAQEANMSYIKNTGTINVSGDSSVGVGLLHNIQGVTVGGTVNVGTVDPTSFKYSDKTGGKEGKVDGAVGIYAEAETRPILNGDYDDHALKNTTGKTLGTETVEATATIKVGNYAYGSSGLRVKDKGSITLKNGGKIDVDGEHNYGAIVEGKEYNYYRKTSDKDYAENGTKYTETGKINLEDGSSINVTGKSSIGYALKSGKGSNAGKIEVTGHEQNTTSKSSFNGSLGFYGEKGEFTNSGLISSKGKIAHGIVLNGDATDGIKFKNTGNIKVEGKDNIALYADKKYTFDHSGANAKISVGSDALGIYAKNSNGVININAPIELAASSIGTTIGIYSDGDAKVNFGKDSSLKIGERAVGLYSSDATKFKDTFKVKSGEQLNVDLGKNSTFGLLNGNTGTVVNVGSYLEDNKVNITNFGTGASLFYTTGGVKASLDKDYTVTNGTADSTAILSGANGSEVTISNGKTVTTNTNVVLIATKGTGNAATAKNEGTIKSTRDKGIAIYTEGSTANNTGTIAMQKQGSVGILGENNSTLTNSGKIELLENSSAGIYGKDSAITNSGSGTNGIFVKKGSSAGIYALLESNTANNDKTISNSGSIKLETGGQEGSAGIYTKLTSTTNKLTTQNSGTIEVTQNKSAGIFAENTSNQMRTQSEVNNSGSIKVNGEESVAIIGKKSKITNSGTGTNGIEVLGNKSAAILASDESEVINSGRIEGKMGTSLVGISIDKNSTVANNGTITMETDSNTGISTKGGVVTNSKDIILKGKDSVAISSENANVTNAVTNGKIEVNKENSVGIYTKLNNDTTVNISNAGTVSLLSTAGSPNKSAAIYSLYDNAATGTLTTTNSGTINVGQESSVGIFAKNASTQANTKSAATNIKNINVTKQGSVGMLGEKSTLTNTGTGSDGIELSANKTAGMIGNKDSIITNSGRIETKIASPTSASEGLVGISVNNSRATNEASGTITIGTDYSTGIYGEANSTLTNKGNITGTKENVVGIASKSSIVTNAQNAVITLSGKASTGVYGEANSTLLNDNGGKIITKGEASVGIYSKSNTAVAQNAGTIVVEDKNSAAMLGDEGKLENIGIIETKKEKSAGIYAKNTDTTNKKNISIDGKNSVAVLVELNGKDKLVSGVNDSTASIIVKGEDSAGMLGKVTSTTTGANAALSLINEKDIEINTKKSVGMMLVNDSTNITKDKVKATNKGSIKLSSSINSDKGNIGILANKNAVAFNEGTILVNTTESIGMLAENNSDVINNKTITLAGEKGIGMLAKDANSNAVNNDTIDVNAEKSLGMLAKDSGDIKNKKLINVSAENGVGMFISDTGKGENTVSGTIALENKNAVGVFAKNNGDQHTAINSGTIVLGKDDGSTAHESLIAMFAQAEAGKKASVKNTGNIKINTKKSVGMYAKNDAASITDVDLNNEGTININSEESAGIYAPKGNISKVGKIVLTDSMTTNGSSAVYVSKGGKVSATESADINLGEVNQNRVAYYVNGAGSSLNGTNIGKISGHGVGVYLQGNSASDVAKIDNNTATLDYKVSGLSGDGIIGLYLNGNTDISAYTKGIKVGNTVEKNIAVPGDKGKYSIGIYTNGQGTTASSYKINTDISGGKNSVGIYADNNSNIEYKGTIEVGDGTTAGTGIFITKSTAGNTGNVKLAGNTGDTTIKLKGTGGVAVIASEGTKFDGGKATIELIGKDIQGVGVYAKKGSTVNVDNWTFNNNGNSAEEVRSEEGGVYVTADRNIKPRMVLTHVINGETGIVNGKKVTAVSDGTIKAKENIGLMAEGIKNPTAPSPLSNWKYGDFEIENNGEIDFSMADKSTAIFSRSARIKNDGVIKVGDKSTAIYGIYDDTVRKFDGAPAGSQNKLELETTANSKITLGNNSTGMYLVNAEKINNLGGEIKSDTGATGNVGIYAINGQDAKAANNKVLTMNNAAKITLGDASVGLYSKGKSDTLRNTVTNTGDITVGNKVTINGKDHPAVAIYAENTKLDTNSKVEVGQNGIAFYGKNAEININGGSVNFQNKGVLAYLENSKLVSRIGNLASTQNTMLYLKNSTAQLDGAGTKVDMSVADNYTGAYIEGASQLTGLKSIELGENSTGVFLKDANFISDAEIIKSTKAKAKGILAMNSNLTNNSKISLSGAESIGIYSNSDATKSFVNKGEMTLSGKKTIGVLLKGAQPFENKADIKILASANSKEPTIGVYTSEGTSNIKHSSGTIDVGEKSIGIYSTAKSNVEIINGKINVADQAVGIYKQNGKIRLNGELNIADHIASGENTEPTGIYGANGVEINDNASKITIGKKSYGFILNNTDSSKINIYNNSNTGIVNMKDDSVFLYSNGKAVINNNRNIDANNSNRLMAFYIKNGGDFTNNGTIDFSTGKGNIGIYAPGGKATNKGRILVGKTDDIDPLTGKIYTDMSKVVYGIGMAADNKGHIINEGEIRVSENKSIGLYGSGLGTIVENKSDGKILLDGSKATATNKIDTMTGVYVDNGATFKNYGTIKTTDAYAGRDGKINENVKGLVGVAVMNGSTLENHGDILIDADNSYGVIIRGERDQNGNVKKYAVIKNYGNIKVRGRGTNAISWKDVSQADIKELEKQINNKIMSDPAGQELRKAAGTDKEVENIKITVKDGKAVFTRNGVPVPDNEVAKIEKLIGNQPNLGLSDIGFYVDTLGKTKPIDIDGATPPINSQLIIGTEYSEMTNSKQWIVKDKVIKPFLDQIQGRNFKLKSLAGSLTWMATPILNNNGEIKGIAMAKIPYTSFVKKNSNAYNFTDGLEQRYDMNALNSAEKQIFNKLNSIGKNEQTLLTQAYDEMMGHQYANVQQRIHETSRVLDKEFKYLKNEWRTMSKDSNKIKVFGMKGEYSTDTAGIIDYKSNAYGVAYLGENETFKLGETSGWYAGLVENTFKFKDIGNSKEKQLQGKLGLFKSKAFDDNNSLNWTISGEGFVGYNKMHRRYLVVDKIFGAKSNYWSYGVALRNELSKDFRMTEKTNFKVYGAVKAEYGKHEKIKEKDGEMRLEIKSNDYLSIKPEIGAELGYKQTLGNRHFLNTKLNVAYENELGKLNNVNNKARVAYTTADWYTLRSEKEDRRGNIRADLSIGLDNERYGVTANIGYDTKGKNRRAGLGLRVIF